MAESGFSASATPAVPAMDKRGVFAGRPREDGQRVQPVREQDPSAATGDSASKETDPVKDAEMAERARALDALAAQALKNSRLKIRRDRQSGDFIYLMVDQDTGETVRRWPPEKHSDLVEYLRTQQAGLLDRKA